LLCHADAEPAQPSGAADASLQPALAAAFDHAIMNLPASALISRAHLEEQLPLVHCYCFQRKDESHAGKTSLLLMCLAATTLMIILPGSAS